MKPSARTLANRRNARRSTGPKSAVGKAVVSRNALRHGLAVPVELDPALAPEIERFAQEIVGADASLARIQRARRIAEAQVDIMRIRRTKNALLSDPHERLMTKGKRRIVRRVGPTKFRLGLTEADLKRRLKWRADAVWDEFSVVEDIAKAWSLFSELSEGQSPEDMPPPPLEQGFENLAPKLMRLDRYERRALSRRKQAIQEFDAFTQNDEMFGVVRAQVGGFAV